MMRANYSSAKAGIIGLTKAVARELAPSGINVNAVAPGIVQTDLIADMPEPRREEFLRHIPQKRFGSAEEVAQVVMFLVSDAAEYITGQVICVDGGLRM
jgi:3-oxoacyl-[acyl-carrier protein] reductase